MRDSFGTHSTFRVAEQHYRFFDLSKLAAQGMAIERLPYALRILLENLLRHEDGVSVTADDIVALASWDPNAPSTSAPREIAFRPARVLLQDFTGVPALVDLAAMRDAVVAAGGDAAMASRINPVQPVELVIDHSIQVDAYGSADAMAFNADLDFARNQERYAFLRWGQQAFQNVRVVPPNMGIVHQVNLEYLARVVFGLEGDGRDLQEPPLAFPDTLVGTDSHTPMVNGMGVLGWGVGGIEAEAAMLGQTISMLLPPVVGFRLEGALREGATATDLVLNVTEILRRKGVVGKFVEFFGPGLATLSLADRATIGNMSPEYGATCAIFPVDEETLRYLRFTGRPEHHVRLVEAYMKNQGLFHSAAAPEPIYSDYVSLDLASVEPSMAGPRRPQDRVPLADAKRSFVEALASLRPRTPSPAPHAAPSRTDLTHGAVVIAAITSCTNTSNPSVMLAAGLLAKKAVARGLQTKPWVKTSLAPGSRVVSRYFHDAQLTPYLDALGFHTVGYGCTTCIGNSGPLPLDVSRAVAEQGLVVCAVLSGNRNFEGRIHPEVRANYLMSPPLVVAHAIAGRVDIDWEQEPLGIGKEGQPVFLRDIWPTHHEINEAVGQAIQSAMYRDNYAEAFAGDMRWRALHVQASERFAWDLESTYVKQPPYFQDFRLDVPATRPDIHGARALLVLGDSITTDHISPAGSITRDSPAGAYLIAQGIDPKDFNSYGARRGNHEVMVRGTFANVRLRNRLVPELEGGWTRYLPTGEIMSVYDAAMRYRGDGTPLLVLAGKEYGSGSSRDWAAKGPRLQGVKAIIAESYERIHRSNLIGMGILPLQFKPGDGAAALGLTGEEIFSITGLQEALTAHVHSVREVEVRATASDGTTRAFAARVRIDTPQELGYYLHDGILPYALRFVMNKAAPAELSVTAAPTPPRDMPIDDNGSVDESSIESFPASDPPAL